MKKKLLHEIIAAEGDVAAAASAILKEASVTFGKKADLFIETSKTYKPFDDEAVDGSAEVKTLTTTVDEKLNYMFNSAVQAVDINATKDQGNLTAKSDVVLGGKVLLKDVPATTLLMLEGKVKKWQEVFVQIPTLAPGRKWEKDPDFRKEGVYRDAMPEETFRTQRTTKHKVLVEPTEHHPAQIDKWQEDERIGKFIKTTWSGMLSPAEKSRLLGRTQKLLSALKEARMRANTEPVEPVQIGGVLKDFLLTDTE